jgi:acyl carrier protein
MTEDAVFEQLKGLIVEILGVAPEKVRRESVLVADLGAESIDLLDLSFQIEARFGVTIEPNEMEREAKLRLGGGAYEQDGLLTEAALAEIRKSATGLDPAKLQPGLRKWDLPTLLTVEFFVQLILRKLAAKPEGAVHA